MLLTPTTRVPAPTANTISVTAGTSEMIRAGRALCGAGRCIAAVAETSNNRPAIAVMRIASVLRIFTSAVPAATERTDRQSTP